MDKNTLLALRRAPRRLWVLAAISWLLGLAFLHGSDLFPVVRLSLFGTETEGTLVGSRELDRGSSSRVVQAFTIEFHTAEGEPKRFAFETLRPSEETLERLYPSEGGVRVVYLPSNPRIARLVGELGVVWFLVGLAVAFAVLGTLPILHDWIERVGHRLPPEVDATVDRWADRVDRLLG